MSTLYMVRCSYMDGSSELSWNNWYTEFHVPEMLDIPGFLSGARYRATDGESPMYLARYEIACGAVLDSNEYQVASGGQFPAPWAEAVTQLTRWAYQPLADESMPGDNDIAGLLLIEASISASNWIEYCDWYEAVHIPEMRQATGCRGARRYEPVLSASSTPSHLVLYDFQTATSLRQFIGGPMSNLVARYDERWRDDPLVHNRLRRAYAGQPIAS